MNIVYIQSRGHSGSTVLGSLIGSYSGAIHIGELNKLYKVYKGELETCSCGKLPAECMFWSKVFFHFNNYLVEIEYSFERFEKLREKIEGTLLSKNDEEFEQYKIVTCKLFEIIANIAKSKIIVDSSKSPSRALALSKIFGTKIMVIYLQRNLFGVFNSYQRKKGKVSVFYFILLSLKRHFRFVYVQRSINRNAYNYKYTDIFDEVKVNELFQNLNIEYKPNLDSPIYNEHVIAGNRLRYKESNYLKRSENEAGNFRLIERIGIGIADYLMKII